jgi:Zn-dependent membrane protease YugP
MLFIVFIILVLAVVLLPAAWVRWILRKYSEPADRYRERGTGAELARHLLDEFDLGHVKVEETALGDHYDPTDRAVRLSAANFSGYSLTAVTVAAHEVGHALQDARGERLFDTRQRLVKAAVQSERLSRVLLIAVPIVLIVLRVPQASFALLLLAVASMAIGTLVHLVTLPVELDASYGKALPVLEKGNYLYDGDLPHARRILKAAALTYVAGSLASLLNLGRWIAILRR